MKKKIIIGVVVFFIIAGIASSMGDDEETTTTDSQTTTEQTEQQAETTENNTSAETTTEEKKEPKKKAEKKAEKKDDGFIRKGQSFEANGLKIKVTGIKKNYTAYKKTDKYGFHKPKKGMKYIKASFKFENTGKTDSYVSIYDFDCYADGSQCEQEFGLSKKDFVNTNLSSGRNVSFDVFFAVPKKAKSVELEYTTNVWTDKKAIVKVQ